MKEKILEFQYNQSRYEKDIDELKFKNFFFRWHTIAKLKNLGI